MIIIATFNCEMWRITFIVFPGPKAEAAGSKNQYFNGEKRQHLNHWSLFEWGDWYLNEGHLMATTFSILII